ncbi:hypothetical protein BC835DRAFT_1425088 [Cytidiella melzeri]|nr:hypothetical protein BC835DRAFT_1425088 [Cytidiella melzeri]
MPVKLSRPLATLTLDDILAGKTCEPISLKDFESFLMYKQHSVEYLRFVVWYQSYRSRFLSLPPQLQSLSPPVSGAGPSTSTLDFKLPSPARLARFTSKASSTTLSSQTRLYATASRATTACLMPQADRQPFRVECASVANTFLVPSPSSSPATLSMTLDIPSTLLDATLAHLAQTTHPSVFHPIYQLAYEILQTSSLPFFLLEGETNINREKQLYWWLYGVCTFLVGWAVAIGCLFIEHNSDGDSANQIHAPQRAWRLWAVPFLDLGGMQMYAGYRSFCTEVWGRGAAQLRPWELTIPDDENSAARPSSPQDDSCQKEHFQPNAEFSLHSRSVGSSNVTKVPLDDVPDFDLDLNSPGPIILPSFHPSSNDQKHAPTLFDIGSSAHRDTWGPPPSKLPQLVDADDAESLPPTPFTPPTPNSAYPLLQNPGPSSPTPSSSNCYPPRPWSTSSQVSLRQVNLSSRARIFGPERVVLDPRIQAVHRRVMTDILVVGFVWGVVWTVVVLCLPWGK